MITTKVRLASRYPIWQLVVVKSPPCAVVLPAGTPFGIKIQAVNVRPASFIVPVSGWLTHGKLVSRAALPSDVAVTSSAPLPPCALIAIGKRGLLLALTLSTRRLLLSPLNHWTSKMLA